MANTITQTTLSGAINQTALTLSVTSATNITAPVSNFQQAIYVINKDQTIGELMYVVGLNGTQVSVVRESLFRQSFGAGATVVIAPAPNAGVFYGGNVQVPSFYETDPVGNPNVAGSYPGAPVLTPWLNTTNGNQWVQGIAGQWVPGWNNPSSLSGVTAAVASAAGAIVPSGRLFHVTGTEAITGFTNASMIGFAGGSFTIIPDAIFTWTAAGNIALAGTAVVNKALTFTWDSNAGKWNPSYIA